MNLLIALAVLSTSAAQFSPVTSLIPAPSHTGCPPDGPLLPRPTNLAQSKHIQAATENLTTSLDSAIKGDIKAGWSVENVSFSLAFTSPSDGDKPLWEYHHVGRANEDGVKQADGDTQYLIGSVSKVFSDLLLLKKSDAVGLQDPVTKYFPELGKKESVVKWENVTMEALADHLGGILRRTESTLPPYIPPNVVYEFYDLQPVFESLGFPRLDKLDYPSCGVIGLSKSCTKQDILNGLLTTHPVAPVNSRPVYSQLSFYIFSLALEMATGKNYTQLLDETVIQPLQLANTGVSPGDTNRAVVPPGMTSWGSDLGYGTPGGGLYSSINDLTLFINAILKETILPTAAAVRKWLKPRSTTSSLSTLVGRPWEILRTTQLTPEHPHTIDIYGKSGGAAGYRVQLSAIDQYNVGFVTLTAGPVDALNILNPATMGTIMPAVEEEAREQGKRCTGSWSTTSAGGVQLNTSMDNGPGIKVDSITRNGSSIIEAIKGIFESEFTSFGFGILNPDLRIYPAGIEIAVPSNETSSLLATTGCSSSNDDTGAPDLIRQDWRINFDIIPLDGETMSDLPGQRSLDEYCASWQTVDWMHYGGKPPDRIVFVLDRNRRGEVVGVEVPALRSGLLV